jgi:hypothetical protein
MEARRRRRMAEMLAAQAYQPQEGGVAPIPTAAPLVQGLQAFLAARQERKAEEAEEKAKKAGQKEFSDYIRSFEPEERTVGVGDVAAMEAAMPQLDETGRLTHIAPSAVAAPNQRLMPAMTSSGEIDINQPMQMQVGGPLSMAQRRARALEGFESTNPMVQQFAAMQFEKSSPKELALELEKIDPTKIDMASVAEAQRTGDISKIRGRTEPTKPVTRTGSDDYGSFIRTYFSDGTYKDTQKGVAPAGPKDEPLVQIVGPDGKPVLVPRSQGIGKTPFVAGGQAATEAERKDAYNLARIVNSANQIQDAIKEEPAAVRPGFKEAAVGMLPFGVGEDVRYRAQSPQRQVIEGAQTELIDAALTLATGAAYTKEQLAGQVRALIPRYGESDESVAAKNERLKAIINSAKVRAGRAWTPELDQKLAALFPALAEDQITDLPPR